MLKGISKRDNAMKQRESNIELLRIVAMFLVMAIHTNDTALGHMDHYALSADLLSGSYRLLYEALTIVCVDVFILISGWFGIKSSVKGLTRILFQCVFIYILLSACFLTTGMMSSVDFLKTLISPNWFIISYIGLYLLSPFLNSFFDQRPKSHGIALTAIVWCWLFYFGWIGGGHEFANGYSTLALIGLYLLGRCLRMYEDDLASISKLTCLSAYLLCALISAGICYCSLWFDWLTWLIPYKTRSHVSPLVVVQAVSLLLLFTKFKFSSPIINKLAAGSFSVYLLHLHPVIFPYFTLYASKIWMQYHDRLLLYTGLIIMYMAIVYLAGFVLDRLRESCWCLIVKHWNATSTPKG